MIFRVILLIPFLAGCSSQELGREDLLRLALFHKKIPTENAATAKEFIVEQRNYIVLLTSDPKSTFFNQCGKAMIIGDVQEENSNVTLVSASVSDSSGKPTGCRHPNYLIWDVYFYCSGDRYLTNIKMSRNHLIEFKDHLLCR